MVVVQLYLDANILKNVRDWFISSSLIGRTTCVYHSTGLGRDLHPVPVSNALASSSLVKHTEQSRAEQWSEYVYEQNSPAAHLKHE